MTRKVKQLKQQYTQQSIDRMVIATNKGYYVNKEGVPFGVRGQLKGYIDHRGYIAISIRFSQEKIHRVSIHRLQAYQKFGNKIFEAGIVVRHLDGDWLNNHWDNIEIGTQSDNAYDRPIEKRIQMAKKGAMAQRKYTNAEVADIRTKRANGWTYKQIMSEYTIKKSTLCAIVNKRTYAD